MSRNPDPQNFPAEFARGPASPLARFSRFVFKFALLAGVVAALYSCLVFVDETEDVIVERLGRIVAVYDIAEPDRSDRGLHFKWPWPIGTVRRFDRRLQLFDPPGREMFTRDKKNVTINSYVCWRIGTPVPGEQYLSDRPVVKFFRGLGTAATAEARLEARIRSIFSTEIGQLELGQLLSVKHSEAGPEGDSPLAAVASRVLEQVRRRTDETDGLRERLGIEIVDLRLKRINLPEGNRFAVYERMRTERERIAERYRSAGRAEKTRIESQAVRQSEELLAKAAADAERIRGEGEAQAIGILNQAHAQDPEFYEFQRTMAAYSKILTDKTTLVLSASNRLFKLLTEGVPDRDAAKPGLAPTPPSDDREAAAPKPRDASNTAPKVGAAP